MCENINVARRREIYTFDRVDVCWCVIEINLRVTNKCRNIVIKFMKTMTVIDYSC